MIDSTDSNRVPLRLDFSLRKRKKSRRSQPDKYGEWSRTIVLFLETVAQTTAVWAGTCILSCCKNHEFVCHMVEHFIFTASFRHFKISKKKCWWMVLASCRKFTMNNSFMIIKNNQHYLLIGSNLRSFLGPGRWWMLPLGRPLFSFRIIHRKLTICHLPGMFVAVYWRRRLEHDGFLVSS